MKNVRPSIPRDNNKVSANPYISANKAIRPTSSGFKQQLSPTNNSKGQANVSPAASPNISANNALDPTANGFKHQLSPNSNLDDQASGPNINSANDAPNILDKGLTLTKKYTDQLRHNMTEVLEYERKPPTKLQLWRNRKMRKNTLDKTFVFMTKCVLLLLHFELLVNCTNICVVAQKEVIFNRTQQATFSDLVKANYGVNNGVNLEMNYVYPANNALGTARDRALSLSGQRRPPSGISSHLLHRAQVYDAHPVSDSPSVMDLAMERYGPKNSSWSG